jgi:hypothetical protein
MRPAGDLDVFALRSHYTVAELARFANVTRQSLGRLLRACNIRFVGQGRAQFVTLCEITEKIPSLWKSIVQAEKLRQCARPRSGDAAAWCPSRPARTRSPQG